MTRLPTAHDVYRAAIRWCGEKDRETFPQDVEYFEHNWSAFIGLRRYVDEEVARTAQPQEPTTAEHLALIPADTEPRHDDEVIRKAFERYYDAANGFPRGVTRTRRQRDSYEGAIADKWRAFAAGVALHANEPKPSGLVMRRAAAALRTSAATTHQYADTLPPGRHDDDADRWIAQDIRGRAHEQEAVAAWLDRQAREIAAPQRYTLTDPHAIELELQRRLTVPVPDGHMRVIEAVRAQDGLVISVQASRGHYCEPRDDVGPYTAVECREVGRAVPIIRPWRVGSDSMIFPEVPIAVVARVIAQAGGLLPEAPNNGAAR